MIDCPSCGAGLKYDIESAQMKCEHCSQLFDPYIFEDTDKDAEAQKEYDVRVWVCPGCGAKLETTDDNDITAVCSYCGNARVIFDKIAKNRRPKTIIPFSVTKDECKRLYMKQARRSFLSPGKLREKGQVDSFRGIYMPYWSYVTTAKGRIKVPCKSRRSYRSGDYICTDVWEFSSKLNATFTDVTHDASRQFDDNISEAIGPYDVHDEVKFTPGFLNGFYAETDDTKAGDYMQDAEDSIEDKMLYDVGYLIDRSKYRIDESNIEYPDLTMNVKRTLYPVWFMSHRKGKNLTYAAVNGSSGKVIADFPISPLKFIIFALLIAGAVFGFMTAAKITMMPKTALMLTLAFTILAWVLNCGAYKKLKARDDVKRFDLPDESDASGPETERSASKNMSKMIDRLESGSSRTTVKDTVMNVLLTVLVIICGVVSIGIFLGSNALTRTFEDFAVLSLIAGAAVFALIYNKKVPDKNVVQIISVLLVIAAALCSMITVAVQPKNDYYYLIALINSAVFLIQAVLTFREHNKISYRMPPQFNKKGGDNNA